MLGRLLDYLHFWRSYTQEITLDGECIDKPRCVLHIGMPKTGSSSIQVTLSSAGVIENCEYLKIGNEGNHSTIIYSLFTKRPELHHVHKAANRTGDEIKEYIEKNKQRLENLLTSIRSKQYIISGEDILFLEEDELRELKKWLMQFSSQVHVIAYVRPPIAFMQSAFQQKVKEGDLRYGLTGFYPEYKKRFEKFDRVFGQGNVFLKKFDTDFLFEGDVVLDFCHWIGISIRNENIVRVNESISLEAIALLYVLYKFGRGEYGLATEENYKLAQDFSTLGVGKFKYSKQLFEHVRTTIAEDIEWMENRLQCTLSETIPTVDDGISSEEDLIALALVNKEKLSDFVSQQIKQKIATPQHIADTVELLRGGILLKPAFSNAQLARLKSPELKLHDMLRELLLSLGRAGQTSAIRNVLDKVSDMKKLHDKASLAECDISFSVDLYKNGYLKGWIVDKNNPLNKLNIEILKGKKVIAKGIADKLRKDLLDAEIGDGACAFVLKLDTPLDKNGGKFCLKVVGLNKIFEIDPNWITR